MSQLASWKSRPLPIPLSRCIVHTVAPKRHRRPHLQQLPAATAAINLQYGLTAHRAEQIKTPETDDGRTT
ncbi:hypothetical protein CQW49_22720 (plasmid) [Methylosinus trichosporium OB3b]|uniref:Uncharacterized protein n=1 Tax=Methylosinus trichosporium (strain ATCC 35070 / NCIMB 11131 / UNIQEM 75 / OB3b) TaxID=595536 RepID=A0A2D2D700_METT3|nr:hypothetical protein CQW49_22720 [Methylosinus trichosporium OB3b]